MDKRMNSLNYFSPRSESVIDRMPTWLRIVLAISMWALIIIFFGGLIATDVVRCKIIASRVRTTLRTIRLGRRTVRRVLRTLLTAIHRAVSWC